MRLFQDYEGISFFFSAFSAEKKNMFPLRSLRLCGE